MAPLRFGTKRILLVRFSTRPHSCFFPDTQLCHHWRGLSTVERDVIYHRCYLVVFFFIGRFGSGKKGTSRLQFADAPKSNEGRHGTGSFTFFVRCSSFVIFFGYFFFAGSFFASLSFDFVLSSYVFLRRSFFCAHIYGCFKVTVLLVSFDCKWNFISTKKSTGIDHLAGARGCRPSCFFFGFTPQLGWCTISLIILVLSVASIGSSMLPWALPSFFQFYSVKRVLPALLSELYLLGFGRTYWLSWGGWNRLFILFLPTLNRFYWILLG